MSFFAPSLASVRIFFIFIRVFSSLLSSVHSTMIQPYFTPQFLGTMFSFVLVCAKCSSLQCFSTFLRVLRSALTQQFSLYVCVYGWVCVYVCMYVWNNKETALYPRGGGVLPYIAYTGMCRPTGSWFWSSWFITGYPFQRRFVERGIKNCGSRLYLLLKIVVDYEEAFIWCISRTNKEIFNLQTFQNGV